MNNTEGPAYPPIFAMYKINYYKDAIYNGFGHIVKNLTI